MTVDDISIYNLSGEKLQIRGNLRIEKQASYKGNLVCDCSSEQPGYVLLISCAVQKRN